MFNIMQKMKVPVCAACYYMILMRVQVTLTSRTLTAVVSFAIRNANVEEVHVKCQFLICQSTLRELPCLYVKKELCQRNRNCFWMSCWLTTSNFFLDSVNLTSYLQNVVQDLQQCWSGLYSRNATIFKIEDVLVPAYKKEHAIEILFMIWNVFEDIEVDYDTVASTAQTAFSDWPRIQWWICGKALEAVDHTTYLGIHLSHDLRWNEHVNRVTANKNKTQGLQLKKSIPSTCQTNHQILCHCLGPFTSKYISKVEMVQRRAGGWVLRCYDKTDGEKRRGNPDFHWKEKAQVEAATRGNTISYRQPHGRCRPTNHSNCCGNEKPQSFSLYRHRRPDSDWKSMGRVARRYMRIQVL